MKPVIITVVGFVAGLGGATGMVAIRERDALVEDRLEKDAEQRAARARATAETVAPVDSEDGVDGQGSADDQTEQVASEAGENAGPEAKAEPDTAVTAAAEAGDTTAARVEPPRATTARATAAQPPADSDSLDMFGFSYEGSQRLAKIFAAMKAPDAAAVLEGLEDDAIHAILLQMGDRKAAEILANLDPKRAASLSKNVLSSGGQS